jgi:hypoxanthine phosphoribosyltransferase
MELSIEGKRVVKLWSEEEIQRKVDEIAQKIYQSYKENIIEKGEELVMVVILHGAMFFATDLYQRLENTEESFFGKLSLDTLVISTYKNTTEPEQVRILKDLSKSPREKHILIVEDIVDTGETLYWILKHLKAKKPKSIKVAVLIDKKPRRRKKVKIDFVGFELEEPLWLIGYGLDFKGVGRGLKFIGYLK